MERKELNFFEYRTEAIKITEKLNELKEKKVEEKECREQVIYLWKRYLKITNIHKTTVYYLRGMFAPIHLQVLEEFKKFQVIVPFLKLAIEYQEKSV